ncbi:M15 family metallopeptidase [Alloscardovia omnicolens]|uniref:M15 family metallopeptidase n=1 Tax=Alloscardovia omnicolens TaxID=419015 RepID=UPI003A757874
MTDSEKRVVIVVLIIMAIHLICGVGVWKYSAQHGAGNVWSRTVLQPSDSTRHQSSKKTQQTVAQRFGVTAQDWRLVVVNRNHMMSEMNPQLMVLNDRCSVDSRIADQLSQFLAAAQAVNSKAHLISCYRSVEYQEQLFASYVNDELVTHPGWSREQAQVQVETYSQPAGASEHQTGLAVDLCTEDDMNVQDPSIARAIQELAPRYGFILRFPQNKEETTGVHYEDWHFRYVGVEMAQYITNKGWSLEEFVSRFNEPV